MSTAAATAIVIVISLTALIVSTVSMILVVRVTRRMTTALGGIEKALKGILASLSLTPGGLNSRPSHSEVPR